jgi:hypothetical protein
MENEVPELVELNRLIEARRLAIEDVTEMGLNDVARVAKLLEIEARFLGAIEACHEALARRQSRRRASN